MGETIRSVRRVALAAFVAALCVGGCGFRSTTSPRDAATPDDAGDAVDGSTALDAGSDAGDDGDAGCVPPPCAAPPPSCHYEGSTLCTCGTLVCECREDPKAFPCCLDDLDCGASTHCVGEICGPSGTNSGTCVADVTSGSCWEDTDCGADESCDGARICPCGADCILNDQPGTCVKRVDLCDGVTCDAGSSCCPSTGTCTADACLSCCLIVP